MRTYLRGETLITGTGEVVSDGAVIVEDDRIVAVGPTEGVNPNGVDAEFDFPRHTILPGLIDAHTHITTNGGPDLASDVLPRSSAEITLDGVKNARKTVNAGVTTIRDAGGPTDIPMVLRDEIQNGTISGPRIVPCGEGIGGTGNRGIIRPWHAEERPPGRIATAADGPHEAKRAVREQISRGAEAIKVFASGGIFGPAHIVERLQYSPEELNAIVAEAARQGLRVACHAHPAQAIIAAAEAGVASVEHGMFMNEEAIQTMKRQNTFLVSTLSQMELLANSDTVPDEFRSNARSAVDHHTSMLPRARRAGVKLAMGSDAGSPYHPHGENTHELECYAEVGFDPLEIIEIATRQTANLLGIGDMTGVIKEGYAADLIAVRGDPSSDIRVLRDPDNVDYVMVDGVEMKHRQTGT